MIVFNKHLLLPILLIFLLALPFTGCQKHYLVADKLSQAEIYMNEEPEAALRVLESIGQPDLHTEEHHARYALLYSQALDKNYIDKTNDSLINIAVDYYKDHDDVRAKFLSYYYQGRIYTNANNLTQATLAYLEAEQLVDELGDGYAAGLLYKQIGLIYNSYYDFPKGLQAHQQAIEHFTKANKPVHRIQAMLTLSNIHRNMHNENIGYEVLRTAITESQKLNDQSLIKSCINNLIAVCIDLEQWEEATQWYQEYQKNNSRNYPTVAFYGDIARLHAKNRNFKDAFMLLDETWKKTKSLQDSINLYHAESQVHQMNGSWEEAYRSMAKSISHQNKVIRKSLQQPVLTTQMDFLRQELAFQHYKQRTEKVIWMLGIGLVVTLAGIAIYGIRKRMRQRVMRIQEEKARLEEDLEVLQTTQEKTEALKNGLFESKMKELDKLVLVSLKEFKNEESRNRAILKLVQDTKDQIHGNKKNMANLEKWVNEYKDNVMQHLRSEIVLPDESYYELACYLLANFSVNTIALLMDETTNTIYKRRSRIRLLIQDSSAWHKEQFQQI